MGSQRRQHPLRLAERVGERMHRRSEIMLTASASVIRVGMSNHSRRHRPPRIDMKIARRTEQAFIGGNDDWIMHTQRRPSHSSKIDTCYLGQSRRGDVTTGRGSPSPGSPRVRHSRTRMPHAQLLIMFFLNIKIDMAAICCRVDLVRKF